MAKFLFIGNFHRNSVGEPEIARALSKYHEVETYTPTVHLDLVEQKEFDILLMSKFNFPVQLAALLFLKRCHKPTICWLFDLYWGYQRQPHINTEPQFRADIVITTDGGHQKEWKAQGIKHYCIRQGIEKGISFQDREKLYDVTFVGSDNSNEQRRKLLEWTASNYNLNLVGGDGSIRHEKLDKVVGESKILLGDSVLSPHYWSNRIYEMLGRGAFFLHPKVEGLEQEFTPYEHFIPYSSYCQLREQIDYFLERPDERMKIQRAGYEHCHAHHTYDHRVRQFLEILSHEGIVDSPERVA